MYSRLDDIIHFTLCGALVAAVVLWLVATSINNARSAEDVPCPEQQQEVRSDY